MPRDKMALSEVQPIERKLAKALVDEALKMGYIISVNDGEKWVARSQNRRPILKALASTDSDTLRFENIYGQYMGFVWLIWGNGEDLISDYTDNADMGALVDRVERQIFNR